VAIRGVVPLAIAMEKQVKTTKFYTVDQVADALGVSARSVRRWIKQKKLIAHHFGAAVRIADTDFAAFVAQKRDE
jgi:excisionase family DNA binding protein